MIYAPVKVSMPTSMPEEQSEQQRGGTPALSRPWPISEAGGALNGCGVDCAAVANEHSMRADLAAGS